MYAPTNMWSCRSSTFPSQTSWSILGYTFFEDSTAGAKRRPEPFSIITQSVHQNLQELRERSKGSKRKFTTKNIYIVSARWVNMVPQSCNRAFFSSETHRWDQRSKSEAMLESSRWIGLSLFLNFLQLHLFQMLQSKAIITVVLTLSVSDDTHKSLMRTQSSTQMWSAGRHSQRCLITGQWRNRWAEVSDSVQKGQRSEALRPFLKRLSLVGRRWRRFNQRNIRHLFGAKFFFQHAPAKGKTGLSQKAFLYAKETVKLLSETLHTRLSREPSSNVSGLTMASKLSSSRVAARDKRGCNFMYGTPEDRTMWAEALGSVTWENKAG
jgi:hypothetical protein